MTKYLSVIVLVAAVVVVGCSGGSSGSGAPSPVTPNSAWAISSFTASDTNPYVGSVVVITASATQDGAPVADGTTIEISVAYAGNEDEPLYGLGSIGTTTNRLAASGGSVTTSLLADTEGPYALTAKINAVSAGLQVVYHHRNPSTTLQIYQPLMPNMGSLNGGEEVILNGKGIKTPVEVDFEVNGDIYPGILVDGQESEPISADGWIKVRTPYISNLTDEQRLEDWPSNVTVKVGLGTADEQTETLPAAFTFLAGPSGPQSALDEPFIYLVIPDHGQSAGGQQVTILGRNFRATVTDMDGNVTDTPVAVDAVTFGGIEAVVLSVSADGTQIVAQTPRWSVIPLDADQSIDVGVETSFESLGPYTATLTGGFVYLADEPTPEITALAPTGGPIDGGEQVTIFGHGFQAPAQVTFGDLEAINVQVNDDQTLQDQDTIICVTPDYSQQEVEPPVAVDVIVRNVLTGKVSAAATYTFGDNLYISGNTPAEGRPGDNIVIYGSGFEAPLQVDFGDIRLDVMAVSGTELLVRIPTDAQPTCANITSTFTVTLLESALTTSGGLFTFLGSTPQIYGIDPIFVSENGGGVLTITGEYFNPELIVEINDYRMLSGQVTVTPTTHIQAEPIPDIDLINLTWDTATCVDNNGFPGVRIVSTPVDVTVINLPGECEDTLEGGLVYEPLNSECFVGLTVSPMVANFGTVDVGSQSAPPTNFTVTNNGGVAVNLASVISNHPSFVVNDPGFTILNPTESVIVAAIFMPTVADIVGGVDTLVEGLLAFTSTGAGIPNLTTEVAVSGMAHPIPVMEVSPLVLDINCPGGSTCTGDITVTNSGSADFDWTAAWANPPDARFSIIAGDTGTAAAGGFGTITVQFDATGGADTLSEVLTVSGTGGVPPQDVTVNVTP